MRGRPYSLARWFGSVLLGALIGIGISDRVFGAGAKPIHWNDQAIAWRPLVAGLAEAKATGKPVFAVFYTDWCPHCLAYSKFFARRDVIALSKLLVMVKVNCDGDPKTSAAYAPDGAYIPRTFVLRRDGTLITAINNGGENHRYFVDDENPQELVRVMRAAVASH